MARSTSAMLEFSESAPVGHTATHCPQLMQLVVCMGSLKAVLTTAGKPRLTAERTPTDWISLQAVSQRRHMMHLSMSRTMDTDMSFWYLVVSPRYFISRMPRSCAVRCSSQWPFLVQVRQSLGWLERMSSMTVRRAVTTRGVCVRTTMPSVHTVLQAGARFLRPSTSTTQMRQAPGLFS